jgi:DMSO/TMAO reductase YedYZ molybdopterin-dependent catalytic subunit
MKKIATLLLLLTTTLVIAQKEMKPTAQFIVSGEIKNTLTVTLNDLKNFKSQAISDLLITNHLGEQKSEAKGLRGVLLKSVLGNVDINAESAKVLSEYYFVCKATDGYTVVFSWNELFNTMVGESTFIITEKEGKPIDKLNDAIMLLTPSDFKTGRRHVKALTTIEVRRAD